MEQAAAEGKLDVFSCIETMRDNRPTMVQSLVSISIIYERLESLNSNLEIITGALNGDWGIHIYRTKRRGY